MSEQPTQQPAPAGDSAKVDPKSLRMGYWQSVALTMKHIQASVSSEGQRVRSSDILPIVSIAVLAVLIAIFAGNAMLSSARPFLVLAFFLTLLYFVGGRIGVMRSLNSRQTHLIFNMLIAMFMLGCTASLLLFEVLRTLPQ
ncbi:MAG TPA: hypothetical protein V6C81_08040 [Planktothrix sp.]